MKNTSQTTHHRGRYSQITPGCCLGRCKGWLGVTCQPTGLSAEELSVVLKSVSNVGLALSEHFEPANDGYVLNAGHPQQDDHGRPILDVWLDPFLWPGWGSTASASASCDASSGSSVCFSLAIEHLWLPAGNSHRSQNKAIGLPQPFRGRLHSAGSASLAFPLQPRRCLRPHQLQGLQFLYDCVSGQRGGEASGCILPGPWLGGIPCQSKRRACFQGRGCWVC